MDFLFASKPLLVIVAFCGVAVCCSLYRPAGCLSSQHDPSNSLLRRQHAAVRHRSGSGQSVPGPGVNTGGRDMTRFFKENVRP